MDVIGLRHVAFEDLGSFEEVLESRSLQLNYLDYCDPGIDLQPARDAELLIVLGAPVSVYDQEIYPFLEKELELIRWRLQSDLPTLGICLGAQLIAQATGGRVYSSGIHEIGWEKIFLTEAGKRTAFGCLEDGQEMFHWHGDTFDLPERATLLASSERIKNQAFSLGDRALGLQFHCEFQRQDLEHWLVGHACELAQHKVSIPQVREDTEAHGAALEERAKKFFEGWLRQVQIIP